MLERLVGRRSLPWRDCALHHRNAWEVIDGGHDSVSAMDLTRGNMVQPGLLQKFPTPTDFAHAPGGDRRTDPFDGFYHNKAKSLKGAARGLIAEISGKVQEPWKSC